MRASFPARWASTSAACSRPCRATLARCAPMPEGDTIFRAARALNKALAGRPVVSFETALAPIARVNDDAPLTGRTVDRVESRGKWCLIWFSAPTGQSGPENELVLVTHML